MTVWPPGRVVLASGNAGKLAEIRALLAGSGLELVPQSDFDVPEVEETGTTLSLIHISEPTRLGMLSRMPSSA
mgnify:CR=1 FL=1